MPPAITLRSRALSALLLALFCASAARAELADATAEEPQQQMDDESVPQLGDEPLDLSTPVVEPRRATIPFARPGPSTGWDAKVGVDYRKPSIPAAEFQPGELTAGAIPDQSTGVAWANVTAPGLDSPLGWDKTAIETRLDPAQEQGKLGATLSRSVPLGEGVAVTLQNAIRSRARIRTPRHRQHRAGRPIRRCGSTSCRPTPASRSARRPRARMTSGCGR